LRENALSSRDDKSMASMPSGHPFACFRAKTAKDGCLSAYAC